MIKSGLCARSGNSRANIQPDVISASYLEALKDQIAIDGA